MWPCATAEVSYFDLSAALAELVESDHVEQQGGGYVITDKGRKNGAVTEDELPYPFMCAEEQRLAEINERAREAKRIHAELEETGKRPVAGHLDWTVWTATCLHSLSLPLQEDARQLIQHFRADPQAFLRALKAL